VENGRIGADGDAHAAALDIPQGHHGHTSSFCDELCREAAPKPSRADSLPETGKPAFHRREEKSYALGHASILAYLRVKFQNNSTAGAMARAARLRGNFRQRDRIAGRQRDGYSPKLLGRFQRSETQAAVVALLDARPDGSARRGEFHAVFLRQLVRTLKLRDPRLGTKQAEDMSVVLLQNLKTMKSLSTDRDAGAIAELRAMTRLYLTSKLGE
jgi:hypothetical protein